MDIPGSAKRMNQKRLVFALALCSAHAIVGCGTPGAPQPPSLNLPTPVADLSAARIGDSVHLAWTMPKHNTDHLDLKHQVKAQVCRAVENGPCTKVAGLTLAPGVAGAYTDALPSDLVQGPARLLRYEVALPNHAGKSAGPSNPAFTAAGVPPPALTGLTAETRRYGVLLSWTPTSEPGKSIFFRLDRLQLTAPPKEETPQSPLAPSVPAPAQTLAVHVRDEVDPGHAIDSSALFNQRYRYVVERVQTLDFSGRTVEVQSAPSQPIEISTQDTFPPAVPKGLVAAADAAAGAIDLSWVPDSDSDLGAYRIYRRDVQGGPAERVASVNIEPSYRDTTAKPEHTYAYSVSAVNQNGHESERSPEVEETLPRP
jgi:hypothetical protein